MKMFGTLVLVLVGVQALGAQESRVDEHIPIPKAGKIIFGQMFARDNYHLDSLDVVKHFDGNNLHSVVARLFMRCTAGGPQMVTMILPARMSPGDIQAAELVEKKNRLVSIDSAVARIDADASLAIALAIRAVTAAKSTCFQPPEQVYPSAYFVLSLWKTESNKYTIQIDKTSGAVFAELR